MREVAVIIDGEVYSPAGVKLSPEREPRAVAPTQPTRNVASLDPLDAFNSHLAQAIRLAQAMSEADKRRASEVMEAARGALTMVTRLSTSEQRKFEAAMRAAARGD